MSRRPAGSLSVCPVVWPAPCRDLTWDHLCTWQLIRALASWQPSSPGIHYSPGDRWQGGARWRQKEAKGGKRRQENMASWRRTGEESPPELPSPY